ncbi:hypothetical protein BLA39750_07302 [Burkholderia lata]|uniref:Uncharacterized protein n=1 Tax=Burkholderia lata (strain ATCC 17760 / DSM 23089 / LMG 22485 / NCIMB 9086 / R18194 / 383) TaxID=482957 RepID=A0A6P3BZ70_BURL3|nr:darcynin family protein [Burkholderia lata]VWD60399.1 hypothetical protein BLA39750_07302 [Burkholderia lata]
MLRHTATLHNVCTLVKTHPEWLGFPVQERSRQLGEYIAPNLQTHGECESPRFRDTGRCPARVADAGMRDAQDHLACERTVEALRETPFRDHAFDIVEFVSGAENAYAFNDGEVTLPAIHAHVARRQDACAAFAQSYFPRPPLTETTVAICGTTVVVRDSTVTLWA